MQTTTGLQNYFLRTKAFVVSIITLLTLVSGSAQGQAVPLYDIIYRPPGISYSVLRGEHFDIIFEEGLRAQAGETLWVLESSLAGTDSLTGSGLQLHMPVVLNAFTDKANGFVTPFPFKQEIAVTGIKGRGLSRRHPEWISLVATHELVHAAQAEYSEGVGLIGLIHWFSPDFARSLNMFVPPGIAEGVAVYRESLVTPGAGRLNHPFFLMQFRAAFENGKGWTLSQMLESPSYTRPFDRFYVGGAHLVDYLMETSGPGFIRRLSRWQYWFPFLGYGANLIYATGKAPWTLSSDVRDWYREKERKRIDDLGILKAGSLVSGRVGTVYRRPRWLNDSTIVAFAVGYNLRRGFYELDVHSGRRRMIFNTTVSQDANFSFSADTSSILYSRYVPDALVSVKQIAAVLRFDRTHGRLTRLIESEHLLNPVEVSSGKYLALKNVGQFTHVVEFGDDGVVETRMRFERADFVSLMPRPHTDSLAILVNVRGHQALFLSDLSDLDEEHFRPWIGFRDATIYDGAWSADGRYLAFTADLEGVMNIYVLDAGEERIWRVTNVPYGAMEPSISPSNESIAFVDYRDQRFNLRTLSFETNEALELDRDDASYTVQLPWRTWIDAKPEYYPEAEVEPYNPLRYLAPRMLYPTFYLDSPRRKETDARLGFGVGLALQGTDPLQELGYYGEGILQKSRFFGEAGLQWGGTMLRPSIRIFKRPETLTRTLIRNGQVVGKDRFIRERQGISVGIRVPITLADNVYRSSITPFVDLNFRRDQFMNDEYEPISSRVKRLTVSPGLIIGYRVQQNARDMMPNSGLVLRGFADVDLTSTRGKLQRGFIGLFDLYLPMLSRSNTGIRVDAGILDQNIPSIFNLDFFMPRGRENEAVADGTFLRYGLKLTQPILFIDNGFMILPIFFRAVYLYGFGEYMHRAGDSSVNFSSIGGGIGVKLRLFYFFDMDFQLGGAYLPDEKKWRTIYR